jgi:hypothetical protein
MCCVYARTSSVHAHARTHTENECITITLPLTSFGYEKSK